MIFERRQPSIFIHYTTRFSIWSHPLPNKTMMELIMIERIAN